MGVSGATPPPLLAQTGRCVICPIARLCPGPSFPGEERHAAGGPASGGIFVRLRDGYGLLTCPCYELPRFAELGGLVRTYAERGLAGIGWHHAGGRDFCVFGDARYRPCERCAPAGGRPTAGRARGHCPQTFHGFSRGHRQHGFRRTDGGGKSGRIRAGRPFVQHRCRRQRRGPGQQAGLRQAGSPLSYASLTVDGCPLTARGRPPPQFKDRRGSDSCGFLPRSGLRDRNWGG